MNIINVTNYDYDRLDELTVEKKDLMVIAHGVLSKVNLVDELEGKTVTLKNLAQWSMKRQFIIIAGMDAIINDDTFCSAVIIDNGKILGISDMTHILSDEYTKGNSLRLYDTSIGIIGVIIGDDIFYPECVRALTLNGAHMLIYIANKKSTRKAMISASSASMLNGVYCIAQTLDKVTIFDYNGRMIVRESNDVSYNDIVLQMDDTYISARREEVYKRVFLEGYND